MNTAPDVLGLYWTVSGPVEVHVGREWSLFDLRDRCEQARRVGLSGIGLWHADIEHELEFLWNWFLPVTDERRRDSDRTRALLWEAAAALGAHHVKVGNIPGVACG